jgi:hypothetical protein
MLAFNDVFWLSGFIYIALMGVIWLAHKRKRLTPGAVGH